MSAAIPVTVVVTPRERFSVAERAFNSVCDNTPGNHRFIYIAGGAPPDVREFLQRACDQPNYDLILAPNFLIPNVARNLGLALADSKYVVFLDNDVVVEPGWLDALITCAEEEEADLVGPLCLIGEPSERTLHSLGGKLIIAPEKDGINLRERHHTGPVRSDKPSSPPTRLPSDYSEFHCVLIRRALFDRIGTLDENICGAAEHVDLALHLRAVGGHGIAEPASIVSYLPGEFKIGDLANYSRRWCADWHYPTMSHLAQKWNIAPRSELFGDYRSDFLGKRERCLLRLESVENGPAFAQELQIAHSIVELLDQMTTLGYGPEALIKVRDAYMVAIQLFAGSFRASGRPFTNHLVATASILAAYGANPAVLAAALHHASYSHGEFPDEFGGAVSSMRRWLERRVGQTVADLVFAYSTLQLNEIAPFLTNIDAMPVELAHAILLRIANAIDDRASGDHRYFDSAAWLGKSNDLIRQWMPIFSAVSARLDVKAISSVLQEVCEIADHDSLAPALRPARPLNFTIDGKSREIRPSEPRQILEPAARSKTIPLVRPPIRIERRAIRALNGGIVAAAPDSVTIVTASEPWTFSAYLRLLTKGLTGGARIEIRLQVGRGLFGALVLERGSSVFSVAPEQSVGATPDPVTLGFEIAAIEEAGDLVFRGWPHDQSPAHATIFDIEIAGGGRFDRSPHIEPVHRTVDKIFGRGLQFPAAIWSWIHR